MIGHSIQQLAEIVGGRLRLGNMPPLGGLWEPVGRVVADVAAVRDGDVLLASPACVAANRCCVEEAFERGALGVIAAGKAIEPWAGRFSIQVDDAQWALWQLARAARQHFEGRVIAVAGHVGKSTTMAMIDTVLGVDRAGCAVAYDIRAGCDNRTSGDALAAQMLALRDDADYAVFEFHASDKGELDTAAHLACPHIAVAMAVDPSLLGDEAGDALAAPQDFEELFAALPDDGCAVDSGDARRPLGDRRGNTRLLTYGRGPRCDVQATHVLAGDGSLTFVVAGQLAKVNVWGRHHLPSALAAWCVGRACGVRDADIAARLAKFTPLPRRCQVARHGDITFIDDAAASTPIAARAALAALQHARDSRRRIVVGGQFAPALASTGSYRRLGRDCVAVGGADCLIAVGSGASAIAAGAYENGMPDSSCVICDGPVNALCELRNLIAPGDVVLATAVEPSLADELVSSCLTKLQRSAA